MKYSKDLNKYFIKDGAEAAHRFIKIHSTSLVHCELKVRYHYASIRLRNTLTVMHNIIV